MAVFLLFCFFRFISSIINFIFPLKLDKMLVSTRKLVPTASLCMVDHKKTLMHYFVQFRFSIDV